MMSPASMVQRHVIDRVLFIVLLCHGIPVRILVVLTLFNNANQNILAADSGPDKYFSINILIFSNKTAYLAGFCGI
jgi:hypothetical protein